MEDIVLRADLDERTTLYISPITKETYEEHIEDGSLGSDRGYFLLRSYKEGAKRLEILAKAATIEAAIDIFDMIVSKHKTITG